MKLGPFDDGPDWTLSLLCLLDLVPASEDALADWHEANEQWWVDLCHTLGGEERAGLSAPDLTQPLGPVEIHEDDDH